MGVWVLAAAAGIGYIAMKLLTRKHEETLTVLRKTAETLPDADIEEIVSETLPDADIEEIVSETLPDANIEEIVSETLPDAHIEEIVSETLPDANIEEIVSFPRSSEVSEPCTAKEHQPRTSYRSSSVSPDEARRTLKSTQSSTRSQQLPKARRTLKFTQSSVKSPGLQANKLEPEKRSRPSTPPSDSNRSRRQPNKQQTEGGRCRARLSGQSNGNVIFERLRCDSVEKKSQDELLEAAPEDPSPVSLLDNATYTDESHSPVKHTLKVTTDEGCKTDELPSRWNTLATPKWRSAKKPTSRLPIEREPWKQPGRVRVGEKPVSRTTKSPVKAASPFPKVQGGDYVYGRKGNAISRTAKEHQPRTSFGSSSVSPNEARRTLKSTQSSTRSRQLPKARRTLNSTQSSTRFQQLPKESTSGSGSISRRLQANKEKRSRPPTPPDSNRSRRQPNKQKTEASSLGGRRRARLSNIQQNDDHVSTSFERLRCDLVEKDELLEAAPEYPSPVSLLDNATYTDESPSPVKHTLKVTTDEGCKTDVLSQCNNLPTDAITCGLSSEIKGKKLQNIENFIQKRFNSNLDEARADYIASLCESDPDILEILQAAGLGVEIPSIIQDLGSMIFNDLIDEIIDEMV